MDFAKRAYDHNSFKIDPIVRSLMDTDFYKLLMMQFIYLNYFSVRASFKLTNRTKKVRLADEIDMDELRAQLDHCRTLRFTASELIWLTGQTFYGQEGVFHKSFIDYLRTFQLPAYELNESRDGQLRLHTPVDTPWVEATLWEIFFLTIVNELRYRAKMAKMSKSQLDIMYARAKVKLYAKLERLNTLEHLNISDFGTRRRHSFLWQEHCVLTACEVLGSKFTGTSNCLLAMKHGLDAKGTNAHELPMVLAALANTDEELKNAQYKVCEQWQDTYRGNLLVCLPDTFGTTQFLKDSPAWMNNWVGHRPDSKKAIPGGEELIAWWKGRMQDPTQKLSLFSDGLDVEIPGFKPHGEDVVTIYNHFIGRIKPGFGWGTMLTNDFIGCYPGDDDEMGPLSLVAKIETAEGRSAVKLSDVKSKSTGTIEEIRRYREVFGDDGVADGSTPIV